MTNPSSSTRRILITGGSGLIGTALQAHLTAMGHQISVLVRRPPQPGQNEIFWRPAEGALSPADIEGFDAVVHLAGTSIAARWTTAHKQDIRDSRVRSTRLLAQTLASLKRKPGVMVSASAIGFYGDRGDETIDEDSPPGRGFLPEVCREWEAATQPAEQAGIRVVRMRIGVVLSAAGGALAKMLTPFRMGMGGRVGSGHQYMSWIALADLVRCFEHAIVTESLTGPVNGVAPNPVVNIEFVKTLARVLHRPAIMPMPAFAVRLLFGEMGQALLLEGARVLPTRLQASGFDFRFADLGSALRYELEVSAS